MFRFILALCLVACVLGFTSRTVAPKSFALSAKKSKALPFLDAPAKLDGSLIGDFGFDPLGLTDTLQDTAYVQAAEIKHGRVAMLATVGFVFQQYVTFANSEHDPLKAIAALGYGPNLQVLFGIGIIELATWKATFAGTTPGEYSFFLIPLNEVPPAYPCVHASSFER